MKITSRLGVLLAKIAGKEDSLDRMVPPWATNAEEELMLDIADRVDGLEAGAVPEVATADKGKFLHANEDTGALEWAEAGDGGGSGSGSGVLIVGFQEVDGQMALDKTWSEITTAGFAVVPVTETYSSPGNTGFATAVALMRGYGFLQEKYFIEFAMQGSEDLWDFATDVEDGYPIYTENPDANPTDPTNPEGPVA